MKDKTEFLRGRTLRCRICGTSCTRFKIKKTIFYHCPACGTILRAPSCYPSAPAARARYLLHNNTPQNQGYIQWLNQFIDSAIMPYAKPNAHILDFGSGPNPVLAQLLRDKGFHVATYDPFFSRTRKWKALRWDAILLHEVIEHLPQPVRVLSMLQTLLQETGFIAVRTQTTPERIKEFATWWYKEDPTHLCMFTPRSLTLAFHFANLSVKEIISKKIYIACKINPAPLY